jgi:hypothetical protein
MARTGLTGHTDVAELRETYDRAGSSTRAQIADGLTLLAGLYLAISPWVVGFQGFRNLTINNLIVGLAVVALAMGLASAFGRTYGVSWLVPLLGIWAIIAPWVIRGQPVTTGTVWNNVVTGAVIVVCSLAAMAAALLQRKKQGRPTGQRTGSW